MSDDDIARLYALIDQLRNEVVGYRNDMKKLELAHAHRAGAEQARGGIGKIIVGSASVAACVAAVVGFLLQTL